MRTLSFDIFLTGDILCVNSFSPMPPSSIQYICKICHCLKKANGDRRRIGATPHYFREGFNDDDNNNSTSTNNNINNFNIILTR
jgi:hypothetical protein